LDKLVDFITPACILKVDIKFFQDNIVLKISDINHYLNLQFLDDVAVLPA